MRQIVKEFLIMVFGFICGLSVGLYGGYQHGRMVGTLEVRAGYTSVAAIDQYEGR